MYLFFYAEEAVERHDGGMWVRWMSMINVIVWNQRRR